MLLCVGAACAEAPAAPPPGAPTPPAPPPPSRPTPPPPAFDVAAADRAFGFRLLNAVQRTLPGANVVLSPISAALDLSLLLNGAEGETRQQILGALSLHGGELDAINQANAELVKTLRAPARSITLSVASSLWVDDRRAALQPDFISRARSEYGATVDHLDFSSPRAVTRINDWASRETHGRINEILRSIDSADRAFLLDAVYFKGQWSQKFDKAQTTAGNFDLAGGSVKQVPRMRQSGRFNYFETPALQAIRLPFGDGDFYMDILLPSTTSSLTKLEARLDPGQWKSWQAGYTLRAGRLELPRFDLRSRYRLNAALQALGMTRAFKPQRAQFSGLLSAMSTSSTPHASTPAPSEAFFISSVVQVTDWKVDEEGAEAAAVTSIGVHATAMRRPEPPFSMIVDRPFLCAIEDGRSGALLFIGAIYDPSP